MGRFGNVMLVAGEPDLSLTARRGEVVRLYLTNTANTRVFNVTLPGRADEARRRRQRPLRARGVRRRGAASRRPSASSSTCSSTSPASSTLEHRTPERTYRLAAITVARRAAEPALAQTSSTPLRTNRGHGRRARADRAVPQRAAGQDARVRRRDGHGRCPRAQRSSTPARCIPRWSATSPASCPKCGMKLLATAAAAETTYVCPMHPEVTSDSPTAAPSAA